MHKTSRFTFNLDPEERRLLALLAEEVRRSQGDTLCWLIRMTTRHLAEPPAEAGPGVAMAEDADRPEVAR